MADEAPGRQRIQVSSNIEQVVMFWPIIKNLVKLDIIRDVLRGLEPFAQF